MLFIPIFRALLFYLIPISIGYVVSVLTNNLFHTKKSSVNQFFTKLETNLLGESGIASALSLLQIPWFFAIGTLFLLGLATGIDTIVELTDHGVHFSHLYLPIVYILFFSGALLASYQILFKNKVSIQLKETFVVLAMLACTAVVSFIWNWKTPYSLNWDLYEHQTISRLIQQGSFDFQTVNISDTFGFSSYPPTFHLLLATSQPLVEERPEEILVYWQWLGYFHLLTVSVISYYFGFAISKNRTVALLSGIIGSTVFESVISFTSLFALPQTIAATMFAAAWAGLLLSAERSNFRIPLHKIIFICIGLMVFHYIIGTLASVILITTYLAIEWKWLKKLIETTPFLIGYVIFLSLAVIFSYFINFSWINKGEAAAYLFSLPQKFEYSRAMYGLSWILFTIVGAIALAKTQVSNKRIWTLILLGFTALLLSNTPYVLKFYTIGRYFFHTLIALGISYLLRISGWKKAFNIALTTCAFIAIFILNTASWKQHVLYHNQYSHISNDDLAAAAYLQIYAAERSYSPILISDPTTMYLLEGLSGINTPGGVFATSENRNKIYQALSSGSLSEVKQTAASITDGVTGSPSEIILVVSGRTFKWYFASDSQRNAFDFNIWAAMPLSFSDSEEINAFKANGADVLYENPSYVMFKL